MSKALAHTQVSVILSLNVITTDTTGQHFAVVPIVSFTRLIMLIWRLRQTGNRFRFILATLGSDITQRLQLAGKLLGIGVNSLAWGVGL